MGSTVILTGGAGYIGRCTALHLQEAGYTPILFDDFSTSDRDNAAPFAFREVDLSDEVSTARAFDSVKGVTAVIHFAARALVSESVAKPGLYFRNNLMATTHVAENMVRLKIPALIHSSSCAVYGIPKDLPLTEASPQSPISPYGETKFQAERILRWFKEIFGLRVLNLRYFNPAGSWKGKSGEKHDPETHLIPNLVAATLSGKPFSVFGTDYPTPDGSCLRDLIHIEDLTAAHLAALKYLEKAPANAPEALNIGSGTEVSVWQAVKAAEQILGKAPVINKAAARPGDPPRLCADIRKAKETLGWEPKKNLSEMIRSHYEWLKGKHE